jgi:hypothetical protein
MEEGEAAHPPFTTTNERSNPTPMSIYDDCCHSLNFMIAGMHADLAFCAAPASTTLSSITAARLAE